MSSLLRKPLKRTISALLVTSLFSTILFGSFASAADQPVNHTEASNSLTWKEAGNNHYDIYSAYSIGFMGAEWSSARKAWGFNYRIVGTGASRYNDKATNKIRIAAFEIEGTSNTSKLALWSSADSKYIGSAPESSGFKPGYSTLAGAIIGFAITAINDLKAGYAWAITGLIDAMRSTVDDVVTTDNRLWRKWDWSSDISDTGQYFWFIADVEPNQTSQISTEYMIFGPGYELLSAGVRYRNLEAGSAGRSLAAKTNENWNPGMMSASEKEEYGIEEIPRDEFDKRAKELNISSRSIEEFSKSDEEFFYYAHDFKEYEVSEPELATVSSKTDLIKEINESLERSSKIVEAFSTNEILQEEDQAIIDKHTVKIMKLKELLNKVQSLNEEDSAAINAQRKALQNEL